MGVLALVTATVVSTKIFLRMWTYFVFAASICLLLTPSSGVKVECGKGSCPEGWVNGQNLGCFKFLQDSLDVNWMEAQFLCETEGGFLAEPVAYEYMDMLSLLAFIEQDLTGISFWWIGLSDFSHEGEWVWAHIHQETTETFWKDGSPGNDTGNNKDCALMEFFDDTLLWIDVDCLADLYNNVSIAPLCQTEIISTTTEFTTPTPSTTISTMTSSQRTTTITTKTTLNTTTTMSTSGNCTLGWSHFGGKCFQAVLEPLDWVSARQFCQIEGGELASIHSAEENEFVKTLTSAAFPDGGAYTWIGGTDSEDEGVWRWSDRTEWIYTDESTYIEGSVGENCLRLWVNPYNPNWTDESCFKKFGFVCSF